MMELIRKRHPNKAITKKDTGIVLSKTTIDELYPSKNSFCLCGSLKKYKNCCKQRETKPFQPIEKGLTIISDEELFKLEDKESTLLLQYCIRNLNKGHALLSLETLEELKKKHPHSPMIPFLIAVGHKLNKDVSSFQNILTLLVGSSFLPSKLLRWWCICDWESKQRSFPLKTFSDLSQISLGRTKFYLTEFCLWGLIQILDAVHKGKFFEAEAHFVSLIQMAEKKGAPDHWALKEGLEILESAYYLRRLKIKEGEAHGQKRNYPLFSSS